MPTQSIGKTVSFTESGALQVGAGTSVYRDLLAMDAKCPSYLSTTALTSNVYLASYTNASYSGTLQVFVTTAGTDSYENGKKLSSHAVFLLSGTNPSSSDITANVKSVFTTTQNFYQITKMSVSGNYAYFIAVCQDISSSAETANLVSGSVDLMTYAIKLGDVVKYASTYSLTPAITTLDNNVFALAYYQNDDPVALATTYGSIDVNTEGYPIKFNTPVYFADNNKKAQYFTMATLTTTSYMLLYYNAFDGQHNTSLYGTLHARIATIQSLDNTLTLSEPAVYNNTRMQYLFDATSLDDRTVVVAYSNEGGDLVCQVVEVLQQTTTNNNVPLISFGAEWTVNSGEVFTDTLPTGYMDIDVEKVSTNTFVVLYSDLSNNGALTATMGQITASGEVTRGSPDFLLNDGNNNLATMYSWGSLATSDSTSLASTTGILTMVANPNDCAASAT